VGCKEILLKLEIFVLGQYVNYSFLMFTRSHNYFLQVNEEHMNNKAFLILNEIILALKVVRSLMKKISSFFF
jgi:hypothetical protein